MSDNLRVFVSSSMSELKSERTLVATTLRELGIASFVYEHDAGARPMSIEETYVEELRKCDVYIGIFWKKYGQYTIDEYDKAEEFGKPRLIYQKESALSSRDPQLQAFLNKIAEVNSGDVAPCFFHDANELPERIRDDIMRVLTDAFRGGNGLSTQYEDEAIEPTQLPCLCDRAPQERYLKKGVLHYVTAKSTRPALLLLGGQRQDGHRLYVTRLEMRSLVESLTLAGRKGRRKVVVLPDPLSDTSSIQALSNDIGMMLAGKFRVAISPTHQLVMDFIKNEHVKTLLVVVTITSKDYKSGLNEPLTKLYQLLASFQDLPDDILVGFLVCLQLDGTEQASQQDLTACQALHTKNQKVHLLELPLLGPITPEDVTHWLGLQEVKKHLPFVGQTDVDSLFAELNELRMEDLFGKLQGLIIANAKARSA